MSRLVPFHPDYLEPLKKRYREYHGMKQRSSRSNSRAKRDLNRQLPPKLNTRLIVPAESRTLSNGVTCLTPPTPETSREHRRPKAKTAKRK